MPRTPRSDPREPTPVTPPLVALDRLFSDARGEIRPLLEREMRSAVLISSVKGALRANHYHRTDWHYCYVLSGCIDYRYRTHGDSGPGERVLVRSGQMVFTPPMVDHAMLFPEDTVFLTLSRNPRDQATYEADVVRVDFVDPASA